jgi:hypothetical protein
VCSIPPNNAGVVGEVSAPRSALKIMASATGKGLAFWPRERIFTPEGSNSAYFDQRLRPKT